MKWHLSVTNLPSVCCAKVEDSPLQNLDRLLHSLVRWRWVRLQHGHSHVTLSHTADVLLLFLVMVEGDKNVINFLKIDELHIETRRLLRL